MKSLEACSGDFPATQRKQWNLRVIEVVTARYSASRKVIAMLPVSFCMYGGIYFQPIWIESVALYRE